MRMLAIVVSGTIAACSHPALMPAAGSGMADDGSSECTITEACSIDAGGDMTEMSIGVLGMVGATVLTYAIVHDLRSGRTRPAPTPRTRPW